MCRYDVFNSDPVCLKPEGRCKQVRFPQKEIKVPQDFSVEVLWGQSICP